MPRNSGRKSSFNQYISSNTILWGVGISLEESPRPLEFLMRPLLSSTDSWNRSSWSKQTLGINEIRITGNVPYRQNIVLRSCIPTIELFDCQTSFSDLGIPHNYRAVGLFIAVPTSERQRRRLNGVSGPHTTLNEQLNYCCWRLLSHSIKRRKNSRLAFLGKMTGLASEEEEELWAAVADIFLWRTMATGGGSSQSTSSVHT